MIKCSVADCIKKNYLQDIIDLIVSNKSNQNIV